MSLSGQLYWREMHSTPSNVHIIEELGGLNSRLNGAQEPNYVFGWFLEPSSSTSYYVVLLFNGL